MNRYDTYESTYIRDNQRRKKDRIKCVMAVIGSLMLLTASVTGTQRDKNQFAKSADASVDYAENKHIG